jgi:hypothetical protein
VFGMQKSEKNKITFGNVVMFFLLPFEHQHPGCPRNREIPCSKVQTCHRDQGTWARDHLNTNRLRLISIPRRAPLPTLGNMKHSLFGLAQPKNKSFTPAAKGTKYSRNCSVGTIYLPQCLLLKWGVVNYSGEYVITRKRYRVLKKCQVRRKLLPTPLRTPASLSAASSLAAFSQNRS